MKRNAYRDWCVYTLSGPDEVVRYVGLTRAPPQIRFTSHIREAISVSSYHRDRHPLKQWIYDLHCRGQFPTMKIIERGHDSRELGDDAECYWILHFHHMGNHLFNHFATGNPDRRTSPTAMCPEIVPPPLIRRLDLIPRRCHEK